MHCHTPWNLASLSLATLLLCTSARGALGTQAAGDLLLQGRELVDQGKVAEGIEVLSRAAEQDPDRALLWLGRAFVSAGRFDEALEVSERLPAAAPKAAKDYLVGWAFFARAKDAIARRSTTSYTQGELQDAARMLARATSAEPKLFEDAFEAQAEAAWYAGDLDAAQAAAEQAVKLRPKSHTASMMLGRVAFSQYVQAGGPEGKEAAQARWDAAKVAFERALELNASPSAAAAHKERAECYNQIGDLWSWKKDPQAAAAYASALALAPSVVDLGRLSSSMEPKAFGEMLDSACASFDKARPGPSSDAGLLHWWRGWSQFQRSEWAAAEASFRSVLSLAPDYVNSLYFVYRAAAAQDKLEQAAEALLEYEKLDGRGMIETLKGNVADNLAVIDALVARCASPKDAGTAADNERAARLTQVQTVLAPQSAAHWNNLGLFWRDHADVTRGSDPKADPKQLAELYERALTAYERALAIDGENAGYCNDTAVMLHYYLRRDFERARSLYQKASLRAEEVLKQKDLTPSMQEWMRTALRDSKDNLKKLDKLLEDEAAKKKADAPPSEPPPTPAGGTWLGGRQP